MTTVNIHEAKTHLSKLVDEALNGADVVIARAGKPLVRLDPLGRGKRLKLGLMKGKFTVADDFDAPLPEDVLAAFEGRA